MATAVSMGRTDCDELWSEDSLGHEDSLWLQQLAWVEPIAMNCGVRTPWDMRIACGYSS